MRLPDWHKGAPWYVLPFIWFGYVAMALGIAFLFLLEWWTFRIVVGVVIAIGAIVLGEYWVALLGVFVAAVSTWGMIREWREDATAREDSEGER